MIFSPSAISERKKRAAKNLDTAISDHDVVLVYSGDPIQKPGGHDQTYPFLPHPDYFWISGSRRAHGISAYSKNDGWIDFVLPVTRDEKIWEGGGDVIAGRDLKDFDGWISQKKSGKVYLLGQAHKGQKLSSVSEEQRAVVQEKFSEMRRIKDAEEVALVTSIANMANQGYKQIKSFIRPGVTERDIQIEYETAVLKAGSHKMPYDSIVGTGTNAAVLHAIPTMRVVKEGDLVLIDAGGDVHDYCVDITRVYAANGKFTQQQQTIYDLVKSAQQTSIEMCRPGTEWREIHLNSGRVMAQGLHDLGILKISAEEAMASGAIGVFFPHGVGHMVGLRVRDVGGPPNPNPKKYGGSRVRVDMPLKDGYLMTIEPGLYFIEALLNDSETRANFKDQINWTEVAKWKDFGGIRIEDDILVTAKGPQNLTQMVDK